MLASRRHPGILAGDARYERPALIPEKSAGEKLADLLDYIEQVVRLDERVALRLADYRLPDGSALTIRAADVEGLPGIVLDAEDPDGAVWLAIERLARAAPPDPPERIAPWIAPSSDPELAPTLFPERLRTVSGAERVALIATDKAGEEDFAPAPPREGEPEGRHDLRLRLENQPGLTVACEDWIATLWRDWADSEAPRRRTIALYGQVYRLQQALELGGGDGAVEAVWGIGTVRWRNGGKVLDRPLLDCAVEIELDVDGRLLVRPTEAAPRIDLKPFEEIGCANLLALEDTARSGLAAIEASGGPSPFRPESVEALLKGISTRLAAEGAYRPGPAADATDAPVIAGDWVFHARPRSRHVVLDDIARFRAAARAGGPVGGLAVRLVTPPSDAAPEPWSPIDDGFDDIAPHAPEASAFGEVFFPKPFNADQIAIVRRLERADGLVVQGPPGTGKTHTIANLICHALALGQRVLVVSRGEAALSVLRDQLPEKVRPLTIALLASERQGLRQVEGAIREIQAAVEESRPEIRASAIRRCEAEIDKIRGRIAAIDREIDEVADRQALPIGPFGESPADLARRVAADREARAWFDDAPSLFVEEAGFGDDEIAALCEARDAAGGALDHFGSALPPVATLPDPAEISAWHAAALDARRFAEVVAASPARGLRLEPEQSEPGAGLAKALRGLAAAIEALAAQPWLAPHAAALTAGEDSPDGAELRGILFDWAETDRERLRLAPLAIELPPGMGEDLEAREAVERAARGERAFGRLSLGQASSKERVAAIRVGGALPRPDPETWLMVSHALALGDRRRALVVRWRDFAASVGAGAEPGTPAAAGRLLAQAGAVRSAAAMLGSVARDLPSVGVLARDAALALAAGLEASAGCARSSENAGRSHALAAAFPGSDRTSTIARQILEELVGRDGVPAERVAALWANLLSRVAEVEAHAPAFAAIRRITDTIEVAGAPGWAARLRADPNRDVLPDNWREAWDLAAAERRLGALDRRETLSTLAREREALERRARKLFVELVRERSFLALERRLSPRVKSALVEYVRAVGRLGKGTGKGASRHRRTAREAMGRCYDAVPCWIMPTWRVAEQLPSDIASFDLVILDEASQSDVTELPALLRGRKILAVGDDRQVSPTPPFVTQNKVDQLRHHYLRGLPYAALLEPGESLYDLLRAVFPDSRIMLKEHFRCVEPIIRFSMGFYPEKLVPLRVPAASERLDPPLVDILVPHGARDGARKLNRAEAEVIVDEIAALAADPLMAERSVGVISLIGAEQAELVRVRLAERIGEEAMQRHRVLCGNAASFQGNERDIVFLSMVADRQNHSALTTQRYEQRFNVAASRARDRLVLVRSVGLDDLASHDLRAKLIAHFEAPARATAAPADLADACESGFERDVMERLVTLGYRVEPQVGSEGFRIDLVVEDLQGRRLAVECDGDGFHGPERWRDDMRRQRILERVGWRFWRCFASSFYRDPTGVMADLVATLEREGIAPVGREGASSATTRIVERRVAAAPDVPSNQGVEHPSGAALSAETIAIGDRVALLFPDRKRLTLRLTDGVDDRAGGLLSVATPLGAAVARSDEGDEVEFDEDGAPTRVLVEAVEREA